MTRPGIQPRFRLARRLGALAVSIAFAPVSVQAQGSAVRDRPEAIDRSVRSNVADRPEVRLLRLLASHPATAPYRFQTRLRNGRVALSGVVGTKLIHDVAVRIAIESGIPFDDDLTISTVETLRASASPALANRLPAAPGAGWSSPLPYPPYYYPPYLYGSIDDPLFGFPPVATFPPWWGAMSGFRLGRDRAAAEAQAQAQAQARPRAEADPRAGAEAAGGSVPAGRSRAGESDSVVEMTIDPRGVAVLRGTVNSLEERILIGQRIARSPGVIEVLNLLKIRGEGSPPSKPSPNQSAEPRRPNAGAGVRPFDTPPPPPTPVPNLPEADPAIDPAADAGAKPTAVDDSLLTSLVIRKLSKYPDLAKLPIRVETRDGTATLSGRVPTVFEAMEAFRAAERTPGIDQVDDRLAFKVPEENRANPLLKRGAGREEDVEAYLGAQIRRQIGPLAHLDRVRLIDGRLEIRGTLAEPKARPRVEAILRSMAILRGIAVDARWRAD